MDFVEIRLIKAGSQGDEYEDISKGVLTDGFRIEMAQGHEGHCRFWWMARSVEDRAPCLGDQIRVRNGNDGISGRVSRQVFAGVVDRMTQTDLGGYGTIIWEVDVREWAAGGFFVPPSFTIPAADMEPGSLIRFTVSGSGGGGGAAGAGGRGGSGTIRKKVQESPDRPKVVEEPGRRKIRKEEL